MHAFLRASLLHRALPVAERRTMPRAMSLLDTIMRRRPRPRDTMAPLYAATLATARAPHWYEAGVADTLDGRFDMVALVLSLVLHRIESSPDHVQHGVWLTELFVDDMDGQMRQIGFGDVVVGKQIGRIMSALGGRLGAYRAPDGSDELAAALVRNLWRGEAPAQQALAHVLAGVARLRAALDAQPVDALVVADSLPDGGTA
jgi:cytochrome b pre-mRNA-processing protein 3